MATPYLRNSLSLNSSRNDYRQDNVRMRALYQRANILYGKLSRSFFLSNATIQDIEQTYLELCHDFHQQQDQSKKRNQLVKQNTQQSIIGINGLRRYMQSTPNSLRQSNSMDIHEADSLINDVENVLGRISQKLKQSPFKSSLDKITNKTPQMGKLSKKPGGSSLKIPKIPLPNVIIQKLYGIDLEICPRWVVASFDGRIYLCNVDGDIRIFSYSSRFHRQPLLSERFYLSITRSVSAFTVTQDHLVAYESDTHTITLHTYHGALLIRSHFMYEPTMISRCDYLTKNQFWICSRSQRQCIQFQIDQSTKDIRPIRQLDYKQPVANALIDPIDISIDEQQRFAIHDGNMVTTDRLLIYTNNQYKITPLDLLKYTDREGVSRIERVLLVPKYANLVVLIRTPQSTSLQEILIVDIATDSPKILACLTEFNPIQSIDLTMNGELVYTIKPPINKRIASKMFIFSFIN
ncbi:unnamed protein product [Adineta ricciae]|uniref:Uncharacterized protein n=1 Tax=Adineta ricciae TaxID=249248 RepID=A0A815KHF1_ADIRI|nr:unnamed protein product [Adineta ricciae]